MGAGRATLVLVLTRVAVTRRRVLLPLRGAVLGAAACPCCASDMCTSPLLCLLCLAGRPEEAVSVLGALVLHWVSSGQLPLSGSERLRLTPLNFLLLLLLSVMVPIPLVLLLMWPSRICLLACNSQ
jgi:hypothetical protein